ncbi:hypothetical protein [uncultured Tessaracoccus sp.]|uniref:hypothetical protein n=1 Tax=uncultured Tessaracoccus sp. TaxID=905023 RepID=UPI00260B2EED|nr:hypothetical protein [uncultured Tessaracoccus sp.]
MPIANCLHRLSHWSRDFNRWVAYVDATKDRRTITWGRSLLAWFRDEVGEDADLSDEEIMDRTVTETLRVLAGRDEWRARVQDRPEVMAGVLELVEAEEVEAAAALVGGAVVVQESTKLENLDRGGRRASLAGRKARGDNERREGPRKMPRESGGDRAELGAFFWGVARPCRGIVVWGLRRG